MGHFVAVYVWFRYSVDLPTFAWAYQLVSVEDWTMHAWPAAASSSPRETPKSKRRRVSASAHHHRLHWCLHSRVACIEGRVYQLCGGREAHKNRIHYLCACCRRPPHCTAETLCRSVLLNMHDLLAGPAKTQLIVRTTTILGGGGRNRRAALPGLVAAFRAYSISTGQSGPLANEGRSMETEYAWFCI